MVFLNSLILNIVKCRYCFNNIPIYISFVNKVYLLEDMIIEALILRAEYINKEKYSLNFRGHITRVKKEFFSINLPNLYLYYLGTPILISYKGYLLSLEANIYAGAFWFKVILDCLK